MDALHRMEQLKTWEKQVENHCLSNPETLAALYNLLTNVSRQIADRDAEIQRLSADLAESNARLQHVATELEVAQDELKELKANRRGIIGQAHSDRADLYEAQDRLEQMGESERF